MIVLCSGFSSAQIIKILTPPKKKYFKERGQYNSDSTLYILCEVCYDEANTIDEEHCNSTTVAAKDKPAFYKAVVLDIEKDTSIIKCYYDRLSVMNRVKLKNKITGTIQIISFTDDQSNLIWISWYLHKSNIFKKEIGLLK